MSSTPDIPTPGDDDQLDDLREESRDEIEAPEEKLLEGILPVPEPTDPIGSAFEDDSDRE